MQRSQLAEEKPADSADALPAAAAEPAAKRTRGTAAGQDETSAGLVRHATSHNAAADPAADNEKGFRRLRKASRKNFSADSAAEEQPAAEVTAAMSDGEAAVQVANPGSPAEAQEPAASALQIVGPVAATADGNQVTAVAEEARAPAAGVERPPQPRKGQPKAAAHEAPGAYNLAVKVSAKFPLHYHRSMCLRGAASQRYYHKRSDDHR